MEELCAEGFIDSLFHLYIVFQHIVNNKTGDTFACEFRLSLVEVLHGFVEDIAEGTIVDEFIISLVRFQQIAYVVVEESQLAAQIGTDGSRTDTTRLGSEALLQDFHQFVCLCHRFCFPALYLLIGLEGEETDGALWLSFHHQLKHEA